MRERIEAIEAIEAEEADLKARLAALSKERRQLEQDEAFELHGVRVGSILEVSAAGELSVWKVGTVKVYSHDRRPILSGYKQKKDKTWGVVNQSIRLYLRTFTVIQP